MKIYEIDVRNMVYECLNRLNEGVDIRGQLTDLLNIWGHEGEISAFEGGIKGAKEYVRNQIEVQGGLTIKPLLRHGCIVVKDTILGGAIYNEKGLMYVERALDLDFNGPNLNIKPEVGSCWSWGIGGGNSYCGGNSWRDTKKVVLRGYVSPLDINYRQISDLLYDRSVSWQKEVRINGKVQLSSISCDGVEITPEVPTYVETGKKSIVGWW